MSVTLHLVPNDFNKSKNLFETEKLRIQKLLKEFTIQIEHIGSTAVPNTIGKGIIDIMIICQDEQNQLEIKDLLLQHKYRQGELNKEPDGRLFFYHSNSKIFRGGIQPGDIHIHLITQKGNPDHFLTIKMRDYLLNHPKEVDSYNKEKIRLSSLTDNDRREYTIQKGKFITRLLSKVN